MSTERKGYPLVDVAAAGGWSGTLTLSKCYAFPDEATVRKVF